VTHAVEAAPGGRALVRVAVAGTAPQAYDSREKTMTTHSRFIFLVCAGLLACGAPEPEFQVRPTVEQLYVTHAPEGATLEVSRNGKLVTTGVADALGSLVVRGLTPGDGYTVKLQGAKEQTRPLTVPSVATSAPKPELYTSQTLVAGVNYLRMRDGTTLSAYVTLPKGPGPHPTVVNYSGYAASRPGEPLKDFEFLCADFPVVCGPPQDAAALFAGMMGYATVSVNMRGTGCSGGAYDYFETLQLLDGYDVIEIVGAQRWVMHHQVGMVGLSYPGISQLFVGAQKPPSLAAIAPMSVIGSTTTTLRPGGMLNDGFALSWVKNVLSKAVPYGQGWEQKRVDEGDEVCRENQRLHGQFVDNVAQARQIEFQVPSEHDRYDPVTFVKDIAVPVFLTGSWHDEQTGPYFFLLFDQFTGTDTARFTATNGVHIDGFAPSVLAEWHAFLELFVARRVPRDPATFRNFSPFIFDELFSSRQSLPTTRWSSFSSYAEAVAAWKAEPRLQVIFESGAGDARDLGAPKGTFTHGFRQWPPEGQTATTLYFQPGGVLGAQPPPMLMEPARFTPDPTSGQRGILRMGGDIWDKLPAYDWKQPAVGNAVVYEGGTFSRDTVLLGTASIDLEVLSSVDGADLQVTLTEVRADGKELYLQSGWLRAGHRQPGPGATALWPAQTYRQDAWAPLPVNAWTQVRIGTAGFAHVLRAGSKVRVTIDTPGGTRADWRFAVKDFGQAAQYLIGQDATHASKLVLPVVENVPVPSTTPPCPSLRGQPCRDATPFTNLTGSR
jgi:uncharacterized protein